MRPAQILDRHGEPGGDSELDHGFETTRRIELADVRCQRRILAHAPEEAQGCCKTSALGTHQILAGTRCQPRTVRTSLITSPLSSSSHVGNRTSTSSRAMQ